MALNNYNNLLHSRRWTSKDTKDSHILDLLIVTQNISDDSKKSSDKSKTSNRDSTKGEPAYTRYLLPWML